MYKKNLYMLNCHQKYISVDNYVHYLYNHIQLSCEYSLIWDHLFNLKKLKKLSSKIRLVVNMPSGSRFTNPIMGRLTRKLLTLQDNLLSREHYELDAWGINLPLTVLSTEDNNV